MIVMKRLNFDTQIIWMTGTHHSLKTIRREASARTLRGTLERVLKGAWQQFMAFTRDLNYFSWLESLFGWGKYNLQNHTDFNVSLSDMATSRTPHDVAQEFLGALEDADNLQEFLTREDLGLGSKSSVEYTLRLLDRRVVDEEVWAVDIVLENGF